MRQGNRHDEVEVMLLLPLRFGNAGRFGKPDPFIAINGNGQAARAIVAKEFSDNNLRSRGRLRVKPLRQRDWGQGLADLRDRRHSGMDVRAMSRERNSLVLLAHPFSLSRSLKVSCRQDGSGRNSIITASASRTPQRVAG